jgi:hypothetical protein
LVAVLKHLHCLPDPILLQRRDVRRQGQVHVDEDQKRHISWVLTGSGFIQSAYLGASVLAKGTSLIQHSGAVPAFRLDCDALGSLFRDELWVALRSVFDELDLKAASSKETRGQKITYAIFRTFEEEWVWLVEQKA